MITDLWIENFKGIGKRQHIPLRPTAPIDIEFVISRNTDNISPLFGLGGTLFDDDNIQRWLKRLTISIANVTYFDIELFSRYFGDEESEELLGYVNLLHPICLTPTKWAAETVLNV